MSEVPLRIKLVMRRRSGAWRLKRCTAAQELISIIDYQKYHSAVAALLQFVGHVLLRLWPATVWKDLLTSDLEQHFCF